MFKRKQWGSFRVYSGTCCVVQPTDAVLWFRADDLNGTHSDGSNVTIWESAASSAGSTAAVFPCPQKGATIRCAWKFLSVTARVDLKRILAVILSSFHLLFIFSKKTPWTVHIAQVKSFGTQLRTVKMVPCTYELLFNATTYCNHHMLKRSTSWLHCKGHLDIVSEAFRSAKFRGSDGAADVVCRFMTGAFPFPGSTPPVFQASAGGVMFDGRASFLCNKQPVALAPEKTIVAVVEDMGSLVAFSSVFVDNTDRGLAVRWLVLWVLLYGCRVC